MDFNIKKHELNFIQKGILHTELINPKLLINNISVFLIYKNKMNLEILKRAISIFINKNNAFNIKIIKENNKYFQCFKNQNFTDFEIKNNNTLSDIELKLDFEKFSRKKIAVFDNYLYDIKLINLSKNRTGIYLKTHHIISDSWSYFLFQKEVYDIYLKLKNNSLIKENNKNSYIKFIENEKTYLKSNIFLSDKEYWKNKIKLGNFNIFEEKYALKNNNLAKRISFELSKIETSYIVKFCKKNNISPYILILSGFSIFLYKIKNIEQFSVFTPVRNRANISEKNTFGLFVNTLPFEITTDKKLSFLEYLYLIKKEYYKFLKHSKLPNNLLYTELKNNKNIEEKFYQIFFSFENTFVDDKKIDVWHFFEGEEISALSIHISDRAGKGKLMLEIDYKISIFKKKEIISIFETTKNILKNAIINPNRKIKDIEIVSKKEKEKILYKFNKPYEYFDQNKTIIDLFEEQAKRQPNKIAIIFKNRKISYQELQKKSNIIAINLINNKKIKSCVSVILERTELSIITSIAVLKSGKILLQINPETPVARIQKILEKANSDALITSNFFIKKYSTLINTTFLNIENLLNDNSSKDLILPKISKENIATIYFTSGTSNKPKQININHLSYSNIIQAYNKIYELENFNIKLLQLADFSFDVFMGDLCKTLPNGGTIILSSEKERKNIIDIYNLIKKYNVNILEATPGILNPLLDYIWDNKLINSNIIKIIFGAEAVYSSDFYKHVNRLYPSIEIYNSYGLTETTIENTSFKANKSDNYKSKITPIGFPLSNNQIYILNKDKQILPVGTQGEIFIGGLGLNYQNNKKGYIQNPYKNNELIYQTGDIAKWLPDGNIEFVKRNDKQLKIRGFRVELSEIEYYIKQQNFITNAIVIPYVFSENNKKLIAFITTKIKKIDTKKLKLQLEQNLPNYMIPIKFYIIDKIPLNKNGKVDKNKLTTFLSQNTIKEKYTAPKTEMEIILTKIISNILDRKISTEENIFDAGIDSLLIMRIVIELENQNIKIAPPLFYKYPTIKDLASNKTDNISINNDFLNLKLWNNNTKIVLKKQNYKNILLTGSTGFLGIHILRELIEKKYSIYCLIRKKNNQDAKDRINKIYNHYFEGEIASKIHIIEIDRDFNTSILNNYILKFEAVIHSAAIVSHFGKQKDFDEINVGFTKNLVDFCQKHKKHFFYISTMSVSGIDFDKHKIFTENDSYFGQNINENQYIKSKFLAEQTVLKTIKNKNNATIFRVGNLTHRLADGFWQIDANKNASYKKLKTFLTIKCIPEDLLDLEIEMTPVDLSAKAIVLLLELNISNNKIYHIFNHNKIKLSEIVKFYNEENLKIKIVSQQEFMKKLLDLYKNNINDANSLLIDKEKILLPENKYFIKHSNIFTTKILDKLDFYWNKIDKNYLKNYIKND